jgi:hypothetical protein
LARPINMNNFYTPIEDKIIQRHINEEILSGGKVTEALYKATEAIKQETGSTRTISSVRNRYYSKIRKEEPTNKISKKHATASRRLYTKQEDEVIIKCVTEAVLKNKQTLAAGLNKAIDLIQKEYGYCRDFGSISKRWYRLLERLPKNLQEQYKAVREDLAKTKRQKPITAEDIVNIAETRSRNPIHVLGAAGNVKNPCKENELTAACALQLAEMKRQIEAQEKLIQTLSKQLASSNSYRSALISLRYCNPEGSNILAIINALMRAPSVLSTSEQRRLVTVLRAGWPELFKEEAVYHDAITN